MATPALDNARSKGAAILLPWIGKLRRRTILLIAQVVTVGIAAVVFVCQFSIAIQSLATSLSPPERPSLYGSRPSTTLPVDVVRPTKWGLPRKIVQTGSLVAFESCGLYARVSGYLKSIDVGIGDEVSEGQVLAEIDAPELVKDVERYNALLQQAQSRSLQAQARLKTVQAQRRAAEGAIPQADADVLRQVAERSFREKELERFRELVEQEAIEPKLFDEKLHLWEAAKAGEEYARASAMIARAELRAIDTRIEQAKADLVVAEADARVAAADLARAQVMADYLRIVAPFSGTITERNFDRGAYVHSATANGAGKPLLKLARTDRMRVVVRVADPNVPFVRAGMPATVSIDALGGESFVGYISRTSHNQDARTRTMRAEIDLPNPNGRLSCGMYGAVAIQTPPPSDVVSVPLSCLVGRPCNGRGQLYVVEDGRIYLRTVGLGYSDGKRVEVLQALKPTDLVLADGSSSRTDLRNGVAATAIEIQNTPTRPGPRIGPPATLQARR
jgi:RND family efflux transporter MFP subunit